MDTLAAIDGPGLRFIRRSREVRQVALARALGVSRRRVQNLEQQRRVTQAVAERYLAALRQLSGQP